MNCKLLQSFHDVTLEKSDHNGCVNSYFQHNIVVVDGSSYFEQ